MGSVTLEVAAAGASATQYKHEPVMQYVTQKSHVALVGKKTEMFCIFGGTPLPQTIWSKNGRPIRFNNQIKQRNYGKSLAIKEVTFADEGNYTCEVSNGVGDAKSYTINLTVVAVPYFTVEPEIVNAAEGETATFTCKASGVPEPDIKWIHNGVPIERSPANPRRRVTANSIIIERLDKTDTGNYGCNATNSLGYVYKDVYVNVLVPPPEITEPPKEEEKTVDGRTVTLTCRVFGAPKPEIKWLRNNMELTGGRYTTLESGDLSVREVNFLDAGNYTCYAQNKFGTAEASGRLSVKEHTRITDEPEDYEIRSGSTATFCCNAVTDSSLNLDIDWLKFGQPIDFETDTRFVKSSDFSLIVTKTTVLDSGVYTCLARTELDEARAQATLIVQDVPNPPHMMGVECNSMDAVVSWIPRGYNHAPILGFIIQYKISFALGVSKEACEKVPANNFTHAVAMMPWANYTFHVFAQNKIGFSEPSEHSTVCLTEPNVPFKNPDNVKGEGSMPDNLVITWTPMHQMKHNAENFHYIVYWRRNIPNTTWEYADINDWRQNSYLVPNQPTFQVSPGFLNDFYAFTAGIYMAVIDNFRAGLEDNHEYLVKVVAINKKGEANVAPKEVIGYSGEGIPLEAPRNFMLREIKSGTEAVFSWAPVPPRSVRGHFKGYKVQTWTDDGGEADMRETLIKNDVNRSLIGTFVPHTKNYARVLVYNGRFDGPPSRVQFFDAPKGRSTP